MEWIRVVLVLLLLGRAIYTDIRSGIIENRSMLMGFITGLICAVWNGGVAGVLESLKMAVLVLVGLYVLFVIRGLGAGDIKLLCVLAAFFPEDVIGIIVIAFVVAAGIALGRMFVRWIGKNSVYIRGETLNFSIPIGIATMAVIIQSWVC